jgi:hypothetical protein
MTRWVYRLERIQSPFNGADAVADGLELEVSGRLSRWIKPNGQPSGISTAEEQLNQFGAQGWELVAIFEDAEGSLIASLKKTA